MSVLVRPAAAADIEAAFHWYEEQRAGLGEEFLSEVQTTLAHVDSHPKLNPILHRETRRAFLHRFPYGIFYRQYSNDVVVVACMHARRNPKAWKTRVD